MNQPDSRTLIKAREKVIEGQIIFDCERVLAVVLKDARYGQQPASGLQVLAKAIARSKPARRAVARQLASTANLHEIDQLLNTSEVVFALQNSALAKTEESERNSKRC